MKTRAGVSDVITGMLISHDQGEVQPNDHRAMAESILSFLIDETDIYLFEDPKKYQDGERVDT
ncbi:MAG: hypothetical protein OEX12_14430 [Gammaproteobacteria bacterium]|nr:hypothetical protein [Gammaproteobacteria bacterium]